MLPKESIFGLPQIVCQVVLLLLALLGSTVGRVNGDNAYFAQRRRYFRQLLGTSATALLMLGFGMTWTGDGLDPFTRLVVGLLVFVLFLPFLGIAGTGFLLAALGLYSFVRECRCTPALKESTDVESQSPASPSQ